MGIFYPFNDDTCTQSDLIRFVRVGIEKCPIFLEIPQISGTIPIQLVVNSYQLAYFLHYVSSKAHDRIQNLCSN